MLEPLTGNIAGGEIGVGWRCFVRWPQEGRSAFYSSHDVEFSTGLIVRNLYGSCMSVCFDCYVSMLCSVCWWSHQAPAFLLSAFRWRGELGRWSCYDVLVRYTGLREIERERERGREQMRARQSARACARAIERRERVRAREKGKRELVWYVPSLHTRPRLAYPLRCRGY
jgi:hypothetical protein